MDINGEWLSGILQSWVADALKWVAAVTGGVVRAWVRANGWRWADALSHGLITTVCLYILLHGLSARGAMSRGWLVPTVLLVVSLVVLLLREWRERATHIRTEWVTLPLGGISTNAPRWMFPPADQVLQGFGRLKNAPRKGPVKIMAGAEGRPVADLLVQMLQYADWVLQDDPHSASYVFLLPHESSLRGIRVRCRDSLSTMRLESLLLDSVLANLFPGEVTMESFPDTDAYNFIQVEIGAPPSLPKKDHF